MTPDLNAPALCKRASLGETARDAAKAGAPVVSSKALTRKGGDIVAAFWTVAAITFPWLLRHATAASPGLDATPT